MKELLKPFLLGLTILFASLNTYAGSMSGPSEACGTETVTYRADTRLALQAFFNGYHWTVVGGKFSNGQTTISYSHILQDSAHVTWDHDQTGVTAYVRCIARYDFEPTTDTAEMYPTIQTVTELNDSFTSVTPGGVFQTNPYYINLPYGSGTFSFNATDQGDADEYTWKLLSTRPARYDTTTSATWSLYLSDYEDGTIQGEAENTGNCSSIESRVSGYIYRKLATPEWDDTKGIICTNSTFNFTVYDVSGANSYYWEPTGGFKVWNGSSYVTTPVSTVSASISVKAPSSNGAGSISVTAKRSSNGVLDSETISMDLWSGVFSSPTVTGTAAVCHNSIYTYTAQVPYGSPSSYTYAWTKPSGWSTMSQLSNSITLATPTLSSNMTYGTVRVNITNTCGSSGYSGITVYPGFSCGGYYMASPNPATDYVDIDIASDEAKTLEASYSSDVTITVVDKMGAPMLKQKANGFPYRLNTGTLKKGEYVVHILSQPKGNTSKEIRSESLKIIVN